LRVVYESHRFYWGVLIRGLDRVNGFFEAVWPIPEGITYNSYLLDAPEGPVLLDTSRLGHCGGWLEELRRHADPRDLAAVVLHHVEPDHSGCLPTLLRENPGLRVYASPAARRILEAIYPIRLKRFTPLRPGANKVAGLELEVIPTPMLHWPETVMTLSPEGVLFSGDAFGAYSVPEAPAASQAGGLTASYVAEMRKYYATVIGSYRRQAANALKKLQARPRPKTIAPLHGLVLDTGEAVEKAIKLYMDWSSGVHQPGKAVLVEATAYGATSKTAETLQKLLEEKGYTVKRYPYTSTTQPDTSDILGDALDAELIVIAASTYEAEVPPPLSHLASLLCKKTASGQKTIIAVGYAWSPGAGKKLAQRLQECGHRTVKVVEYTPSNPPTDQLQQAVEHATQQ